MNKTLTIYFTSDTHGYLFPTTYASEDEVRQGLLKTIAAFEKDENTLIIDGGDTLQGSPLSYYLKGQPIAKGEDPIAQVFNFGGYDFVTLGNHDFNYGLEYLENYLRTLNATCLCANIKDVEGNLPIQNSAVLTLANGLKVGIVGICTDHVRVWENPETTAQLMITDPLLAAKAELDVLKPQADITICLYHGGYEVDLETGAALTQSTENVAGRISRELSFDLLLTGHQHMAIPALSLYGTHGVQPPANAISFCKVEVEVTADGAKTIKSELLPPAEAPHAAGYAKLLPLEEKVQQWLHTPVGTLSQALEVGERIEMALNGTLIANFINQVQLAATGAQISAVGLANSIKGFSKDATVRDIVATYVFANNLSVLSMSGEILKQYAEHCASFFTLEGGTPVISDAFARPKLAYYNYDFFSGMTYTFDIRKPVGERVVKMEVGGKAVTPDEVYTVCMNNYRATGTGGFEFLTQCPILQELGTEVSELIINYIENGEGEIAVDTQKYITVLY